MEKKPKKSLARQLGAASYPDELQAEYATTFDKILAHYKQGDHPNGQPRVRLTAQEEAIADRWELAFHYLRQLFTTEEVVMFLMAQKEVSRRTAYADIAHARKLYGDVAKSSKESVRVLLAGKATEILREAIENKDLDTADKMMKNLIKLHALDQEDPDLPDFSKLKPHTYIITSDASRIKGLEAEHDIEKLKAKYGLQSKFNSDANFIEDARVDSTTET